MDNVYVYLRNDLPPGMAEFVTVCPDGYTVYINAHLDDHHRIRAYEHALKHIENGDFDLYNTKDVQEIELAAHGLECEEIALKDGKLKKKPKKRNYNARKVNYLKSIGFDFFSAAEERWLNP